MTVTESPIETRTDEMAKAIKAQKSSDAQEEAQNFEIAPSRFDWQRLPLPGSQDQFRSLGAKKPSI